MSVITKALYPLYWRLLSRYLDKRQPAVPSVTLVQKLIFILPTRYGWWFFGLIVLLYLLGTNYQNNLILLLSYLLLSLFLLSIVLCYQNLSGLTLRSLAPGEGFTEQDIGLNLQLIAADHDDKRHQMLRLQFIGQQHQLVSPQCASAITLNIFAGKRGKYPLPRVKVSSQYPFGLWQAFSYVALAQHYWVYPAPAQQSPAAGLMPEQDQTSAQQEVSDDTLTTYKQGDSIRHLVWKRLARDPATPVVRQQHTPPPQLQSDWVVVPAVSGDALERALRQASRDLLTLEQSGASYGLKLPALTIAQAKGPAQLQRCLQALALC